MGKSIDSYGDLLVPIILNKLPPPTRKNMVREHTSNEWNITELQEAIKKEVRVFESELLAGHLPQGTHPTATFHAGTSKPTNTLRAICHASSAQLCLLQGTSLPCRLSDSGKQPSTQGLCDRQTLLF